MDKNRDVYPFFVHYRPVCPNDMKLKVKDDGLVANVLIDSKIMKDNLKYMNKDKDWLLKQLKIKGYKDLSNILLVTLDNNEKINIYEKNINVDNFDVLE